LIAKKRFRLQRSLAGPAGLPQPEGRRPRYPFDPPLDRGPLAYHVEWHLRDALAHRCASTCDREFGGNYRQAASWPLGDGHHRGAHGQRRAGAARAQLAATTCVTVLNQGPDAAAQLATLTKASSYQRRDMIVNGGWVTIPGTTDPGARSGRYLCREADECGPQDSSLLQSAYLVKVSVPSVTLRRSSRHRAVGE
jgi:hypothetical protein